MNSAVQAWWGFNRWQMQRRRHSIKGSNLSVKRREINFFARAKREPLRKNAQHVAHAASHLRPGWLMDPRRRLRM
jgi:hypothetical protein